ncbi:hypothetical protein [Allorhizobium borbori]|uniref:Uncharacterized protein n=1 Tax=Allorhizobium borbori TaxID=485907 RepID=A0A7W6K2G0_9HYPH|nr:hypothetical protein [Allorhizobium borbori]MBB4103036.1 hypothetical protein [Allorhizobium borbori]
MKKEDIKKQPWFFAVKGAQRDLIKRAGGIQRTAMVLEVSPSLVGTWFNLEDGALMPLWAVMVLETDVERAVVSRAAAANIGADMVSGEGGLLVGGCLDTAKAGLMVELSHLTMAFVDADADGTRTPAELQSIRREFVDVKDMAEKGIAACDGALAKAAADRDGGA